MERYKVFMEMVKRLDQACAKMEQAGTRGEIEALEKETQDCFGAMMVKFPYLQADIHDYALKQTGRVLMTDAKNTVKE